jgi:hypothetical protein
MVDVVLGTGTLKVHLSWQDHNVLRVEVLRAVPGFHHTPAWERADETYVLAADQANIPEAAEARSLIDEGAGVGESLVRPRRNGPSPPLNPSPPGGTRSGALSICGKSSMSRPLSRWSGPSHSIPPMPLAMRVWLRR